MRHTEIQQLFTQIERQKTSNCKRSFHPVRTHSSTKIHVLIRHFDWWSICPRASRISTELIHMIHVFFKNVLSKVPLHSKMCLAHCFWHVGDSLCRMTDVQSLIWKAVLTIICLLWVHLKSEVNMYMSLHWQLVWKPAMIRYAPYTSVMWRLKLPLYIHIQSLRHYVFHR